MEKGKVKWFNETKGFGFIEMENGKDIFVHKNDLQNRFDGLREGQEVEFDIKESDRGPAATNVK